MRGCIWQDSRAVASSDDGVSVNSEKELKSPYVH